MQNLLTSTATHNPDYIRAGGDIVAILMRNGSADSLYYLLTDHLGNWEKVMDEGKNTGHEHYDRFKIVNANARLYDPVIGRFFSPDPYVQVPDFTQSFNRYSYCMNNPVMFSDPDGKYIIVDSWIFGFFSKLFETGSLKQALANGRLRPAWYDYFLIIFPLQDAFINWFVLENY